MNTTNGVPYIDQILKINEQFVGLPALPLVFFGCIMFGMLLKAVPTYPNQWIPAGVFLAGILFNLGITPPTWANAVRAIILGLIAGGGAWIAHRKVVSKWVTSDDLESGDTKFIKPHDVPPTHLP